ncbi:MAG: acetamidase/formamidase family protein [Oscillospiraceae bacterium]|nr:acetamidase/formamidase family protein [Oscillospiraceae bacterium]MCL2278055.1 acetamidase/formamidase family protein [Oscillospiraceae bacterium]
MYNISAKNFVFAMSKENPPMLTVPSGSTLIFETNDALDGQIRSAGQSIESLDWERVNPATGPVAIEGAMPGDAIKVMIKRIDISGNGVMAAIPGFGVFGDETTSASLEVMSIYESHIAFGHGINLPYRPMLGVIGVAPADDPIPCGTPGSHGGNMDCKKIAPGSHLYLPVFCPGALLAMGDAHACMGDGEIMGTGVEAPATVEVEVELLCNFTIADPLLEADGFLYSIVSDDTLESATKRAVANIRDMVAKKMNLDNNTAGMLLSAIGELEICQVVDPLVTVRFGIAKEYALSF